ncbi:MAG TPA: efflux RND transporter periplasmic adaptor subunit [Candidatus Binataceae bacterium]|nr:efflux RND transporter periplasmic adaptor subunit [Candidatus Binataceae bacterium]
MSADTVVNDNRFVYTRSMGARWSKSWRLVGWAVAAVLLVALGIYWMRGRGAPANYVTAPVTRGPIVRAVIATGTVNPVTTVQVGSYVSGPIQAIYADFNAPVKANQLIAKIDPRPFAVKVAEAQAALANARAQLGKDMANLAYMKLTYERNQQLFVAEAVSQDTRDSALSAWQQAVAQVALDRANIQQQQANVKDAQVQLDYTNIISPVDGTVVSRNVDVGQTVAASFQTPTLFLIAKDLTQMQVDTNVSESDIGNVLSGEGGEFRVDAFPNRTFQGTVSQVRQAPITVQNVVTYDVVVTVANPELLLKPGMTANVTIVTARRDDVVRVPLQALRFKPRDSSGNGHHAETGEEHVTRQARVWTLVGGNLTRVPITTGLDDGDNVELLSGDLKPGDVVATDQARAGASTAASSSPLMMRMPH